MSLAAKLRRAPGRIAAGAFILNSGVGKLSADSTTAEGVHATAANAYPILKKVEPRLFIKALAVSEIAVGSVLLLPVAPAGLAGIALTGFAGALVGMYVRTPAMHDRYLRPKGPGVAIAKDTWMLGIGTGLVIDAALSESRVTRTED